MPDGALWFRQAFSIIACNTDAFVCIAILFVCNTMAVASKTMAIVLLTKVPVCNVMPVVFVAMPPDGKIMCRTFKTSGFVAIVIPLVCKAIAIDCKGGPAVFNAKGAVCDTMVIC